MTFYAHPYTLESGRNIAVGGQGGNGTVGWTGYAGPGGVATVDNVASGIAPRPRVVRSLWSTAPTSVDGGLFFTIPAPAAGTVLALSVYAYSSLTGQVLEAGARSRDSGGSTLDAVQFGPSVSFPTAAYRRLSKLGYVVPAGAATLELYVRAASAGVKWTAGSFLACTAVLIEASSILNPYYDGDTPWSLTPPFEYRWLGDAGASAAVKLAPAFSQLIEPALVLAPWTAGRASSTLVHRLLDDPSKAVATWFPAAGRAGTMVALFNTSLEAKTAADLFTAAPLFSFDPPAELPEAGIPLFAVTPGGTVQHGQVDNVDATDGTVWQVTIPWTEVTG